MALRFDPPPGWPAPPAGWAPPEGWQPDPEWPPAPEGWTFWVEDGTAAAGAEDPVPPPESDPAPVVYWSDPSPSVTWAPQAPLPSAPDHFHFSRAASEQPAPQPSDRWAPTAGFHRVQWFGLAASLTVVLGSIVPFVSYQDPGLPRTWQVRPGALVASFFFGLLLTVLVVFTQSVRLRTAACLSLLGLGLTGFCGYMIFSVVGLTSGTQDRFGGGRTVHWSPGPGLVLCIIGTGAVTLLAVLILRIPRVSSS